MNDHLSRMIGERRWVCWKRVKRENGTITKPPFNPVTGRNALSNNPATWTDYQTAKNAADSGLYDGIGFMFPGSDYCGIDLDHVYDPERGKIWGIAEEILKAADSYTEISPSGDGFHILCSGKFIKEKTDQNARDYPKPGGGKYRIEVYDSNDNRYFTVTGNVFRDRPLNTVTEELQKAYNKYVKNPFTDQTIDENPPAEKPSNDSHDLTEDELDYELYTILNRAYKSKHGDQIRRLYEGDITAHNGKDRSHSGADQALCDHLVYWCSGDTYLVDQLFRRSGLMREQWDRESYRNPALRKALEVYQKSQDKPHETEGPQGTEKTERTIETAKPKKARFKPCNVNKYLSTGKFDADIAYFGKYKNRKTGFAQLEGITLYPGLAFLGGVTSLGKTTFAVQLADHLVDMGEHVLYFAMEQQPIEIISKGLTRVLYEVAPGTPLVNIDIKNGATSKDLDRAKEIYAERSKNFTVVNCNFHTTVEQISEYIEYRTQKIGVPPVIFIDYLQLIAAPDDSHMSDKERVDHVVEALKELQQDKELLIICMSNFNRMSYTEPVSEGSFKESGMIEYCADYLWALQPAIMSDKRYMYKIGPKGGLTKTNDLEKKEMLKKERKRYPREIEIVCMKNRNGAQYMTAFFNYYTKVDYFRENPDSQYNSEIVPPSVKKKVADLEKIQIQNTPSAYFDFSECENIDDDNSDVYDF